MYSAVKWKLISLLALAVPMVRPATRNTHESNYMLPLLPIIHICLCSIMLPQQETIIAYLQRYAPQREDYCTPAALCSTKRRLLHTCNIMLHKKETTAQEIIAHLLFLVTDFNNLIFTVCVQCT